METRSAHIRKSERGFKKEDLEGMIDLVARLIAEQRLKELREPSNVENPIHIPQSD